MTRCRREQDPDLICTKYSVASNRSTRLLLLESAVEIYLAEHGDECQCLACNRAREAMRLKP